MLNGARRLADCVFFFDEGSLLVVSAVTWRGAVRTRVWGGDNEGGWVCAVWETEARRALTGGRAAMEDAPSLVSCE